MLKTAFLEALQSGLAGLPRQDIEERLAFYGEMIDDRMEEGLSEEEAVAAIGPVDRVVNEIIAQTPLTKIVKKTGADPQFTEDVSRMYLTHQNVGVQGILDRIEIKNR